MRIKSSANGGFYIKMPEDNVYITKEKKVDLEKELHELQTVRRKEILEALEFAKSLGDLSENAEYHQAREEQGKLEERISEIEYLLQNAQVVDSHHADKVEVGATVTVQKKGSKDKQVFQIVGREEVDFAAGKISHRSPLGQALVGKVKGDIATFISPKGEVSYTILKID